MKKRMSWLVVSVFIISLLAACTQSKDSSTKVDVKHTSTSTEKPASSTEAKENSKPKEGGTLVVGTGGDPSTFNPDSSAELYFYDVAQNLFSRLLKINNKQEIIPDLAKTWEVSPDGLLYTFHLHDNVKWHDGIDFSSADVKYTLDAIKKNSGIISTSLTDIQEVTTPDKNTVVVKLSKPNAAFLGYMAWYGIFILPEHIYSTGKWEAGTDTKPIGTGPFKFAEFKSGVSVKLDRNEAYFGQVPHVNKLIFTVIADPNTMAQSFYNGDLDIFGGEIPSSEVQKIFDNRKYVTHSTLLPSRTYLMFNFDKEPFNKKEVRQAVAYALDNREIVTKAMKGPGQQAAKNFLSPVFKWALSDKYTLPEYNPIKAKQLLEQAGYKPDSNGNYLSITYDIFQTGGFSDIAAVVKDQLKKVGINVTLNVMDFAGWQKKVPTDRKFQMSMLGGYQGPDIAAIGARVGTKVFNNFSGYSNPQLDQILADGIKLVKKEDRIPIYTEVQRILSEDLPIYPINEYIMIDSVQSYVKGSPTSDEAINSTGFTEYNYVWLDK